MRKSIAWSFPLYFLLPYLPEETSFQRVGPSAGEGANQVLLGVGKQ
jgi:hypothetical protein